jgi:hypothetical protein
MARRKDPYLIVPLKYGDLYDFKDVAKTLMKFRKEDTKGGKINWLQIRWLRYMKEKTDFLLYKYLSLPFCKFNRIVHTVTLHLSVTAFKKFVIDNCNRLMVDYNMQ